MKTKNINDNYKGSGKILKQAFDKYGFNNLNKEKYDIKKGKYYQR